MCLWCCTNFIHTLRWLFSRCDAQRERQHTLVARIRYRVQYFAWPVRRLCRPIHRWTRSIRCCRDISRSFWWSLYCPVDRHASFQFWSCQWLQGLVVSREFWLDQIWGTEICFMIGFSIQMWLRPSFVDDHCRRIDWCATPEARCDLRCCDYPCNVLVLSSCTFPSFATAASQWNSSARNPPRNVDAVLSVRRAVRLCIFIKTGGVAIELDWKDSNS